MLGDGAIKKGKGGLGSSRVEVEVGILSTAISISLIKYILYLKELQEPSGCPEEEYPGGKSRLCKGLHREVHVCHVLRITWKTMCL